MVPKPRPKQRKTFDERTFTPRQKADLADMATMFGPHDKVKPGQPKGVWVPGREIFRKR